MLDLFQESLFDHFYHVLLMLFVNASNSKDSFSKLNFQICSLMYYIMVKSRTRITVDN